MAQNDRPTGLIANKGIELLTFGTPNGHKALIILEELKEAYGKDYVFQSINIMENIQKEPWFTKLGPNGRIPVIVDHDKGGHAVMEGAGMFPCSEVSTCAPILRIYMLTASTLAQPSYHT